MASWKPGALLRVIGGGHAFDDADGVALLDLLGQEVADHLGALAVVRADERHGDALLQGARVELVVDIDDDDARIDGFFQHRHQRLRVRRGDHERVHARDDHLLDQLDLARRIRFILDAVRQQVVLGGIGLLVRLGTVFHGQENSLASDFITSATLGLAGVCAMAGTAGKAHTGQRRQSFSGEYGMS
jgi:hypothetical protein